MSEEKTNVSEANASPVKPKKVSKKTSAPKKFPAHASATHSRIGLRSVGDPIAR